MGFTQTKFSNTLINWYLANQRPMPWRNTSDPYKIWVSEILLQQTRVAQGLPYYIAFIKAFPTVHSLAKASENEVMKRWQGLGYYSRARNLHHSAKYISEELNGRFPGNYLELMKLKGVGDYTASAIASICFNEPTAVVDGNVYRVLSRIFGITAPINSTEGKKEFKLLATKLLDPENPAAHNQAIMEFGALQCKPSAPFCGTCPFAVSCTAFQKNRIKELPVKLKKNKVRTRHFNYLVFISEDRRTILQQRTGKDIWRNLYEFPLVETEMEETKKSFSKKPSVKKWLRQTDMSLHNEQPIKHILSHQKLLVKFWILGCEKLPLKDFPLANADMEISALENYPVPVLLEKFIAAFPVLN